MNDMPLLVELLKLNENMKIIFETHSLGDYYKHCGGNIWKNPLENPNEYVVNELHKDYRKKINAEFVPSLDIPSIIEKPSIHEML